MLSARGFAPLLRRINDRSLDPKPLIDLYQGDAAYRELVDREYADLIATAWLPSLDASVAREALTAWHARYLERSAYLQNLERGARLLETDRVLTYIEGVARFVESNFLIDATQHPSTRLTGDPHFGDFRKWKAGGYAAMENRQLDKEYYYAIGFHLALLLEQVDPSWKQRVATTEGFLIGSLAPLL
jgi:hypothetical protein